MPDHNYNVKVVVDVQGKKVMDELAKGSGSKEPATGLKAAENVLGKGGNIGEALQALIGSITPLTAVLGVGVGLLVMAVGNSKVLSTIMGTVGKMLGFMLDIVLLPMMPLIMGLMRFMWQMILAFKGFTKKTEEKGFLGMALEISPVGPAWELLSWIIKWLWGDNKGTAPDGSVKINIWGTLADDVMKWFYGLGNIWEITVSFLKNIPGVQWLLDLIADVKQFLFPASTGGTEEGASSTGTGIDNWFKPQYKGGYSSVMEDKANKSQNNSTFNFYGVTPDEMISKVREIFDQMARSSTVVW